MGVQLYYFVVDPDQNSGAFMSDFDFGEFIRNRRKELNLDQIEAATKAGLTSYTYGRIERGEVTPRLDQITKIFSAFELSFKALSEEHEPPENLTARDCLNKIDVYFKELRRLLGQQ